MARITRPGKFEGETDLVEYLHSLDATETIGFRRVHARLS